MGFYGYALIQQQRLESLAAFGRLVSTWDDHYFRGFIKDGLVLRVPDTECEYTLTDAGAHMMFHRNDSERGLHESLYGGWRTKAEARAAGDLPAERESVIKVKRNGKVVVWEHDAEKCEVA